MKAGLVAGGLVCGLIALLGMVFAVTDMPMRGGRHPPARAPSTGTAVHPRPDRPDGPAPRPAGPRQLATEINQAQRLIDDRTSSNGELARAGLLEELATGSLAHDTARARRATLALLRPQAAATMRTDLAASAALSRLAVPRRKFPPWRIIRPPGPGTLHGYFRQAQSRFRVGWQYLAAIEFIETRFGRIRGSSPAGARGPMQFLPATWAHYGRGSIDDPRQAILAAARYLAANGAPGDMAGALYRYNHSPAYVAAVRDYAGRMRADPRAYDGYYHWQVLYGHAGRLFLLPVGYPRVRPKPVHNP